MQRGGGGEKEVSGRMEQLEKGFGVIGDRRLSAMETSNGMETAALTRNQKIDLEMAELKMLRFSMGVTKWCQIGNEYIWDKRIR